MHSNSFQKAKGGISNTFLNQATDILGDTNYGLSGSQIVEYLREYAYEANISIPYSEYPFTEPVQNKRTALRENLKSFPPYLQYKIIKELCELNRFKKNEEVSDLKIRLITTYYHLSSETNPEIINTALLEETRHWLSDYPESLKLFEDAKRKFEGDIFKRNLIDDLRLCLEKLIQKILNNKKSIENQITELGSYIKQHDGSKELNNMFVKIIDYYSKYQNSYIKHNDSVKDSEIEIIFEISCSMMKYLIRIGTAFK